jgi:hypothetical protein
MTDDEAEALMAAIAPPIKRHVERALGPLIARLDVLEARIERQIAEFKYLGAWDSQREYQKGNFVTHGGSIWHCNAATRAKPGDSADWTLAVKRGRDAA